VKTLRRIVGAFFLCALAFSQPLFASEKEFNFLTLADIHYDPFVACHQTVPCPLIQKLQRADVDQWHAILSQYDNDAPQYHIDTNSVLLFSSLVAAKQAAALHHVQFVMVLGDFLAHDYRLQYIKFTRDHSRAHYQLFVKKTLIFLNNELARTFPSLTVYMVEGNNDSYRGDYYSSPNSQFFLDTAERWSELIQSSANRSIMKKEFSQSGYYAIDVPNVPSLRLIVMNTVLFSYKSKGEHIDEAAKKELAWLHNQLSLAKSKKQQVLIAMHIPPGIDIYASLKIRLFRLVALWMPAYTMQFEEELKQFSTEIVGILAGHLHSDWSQIISTDHGQGIPMSGTPSISPIFGNNPGFKIYTYTPGQKLERAETHNYLLNYKWSNK